MGAFMSASMLLRILETVGRVTKFDIRVHEPIQHTEIKYCIIELSYNDVSGNFKPVVVLLNDHHVS